MEELDTTRYNHTTIPLTMSDIHGVELESAVLVEAHSIKMMPRGKSEEDYIKLLVLYTDIPLDTLFHLNHPTIEITSLDTVDLLYINTDSKTHLSIERMLHLL